MKSIMQIIKKRYSVRKYKDKKIEYSLIKKCVEAARLAPSAENVQPWRFLVIDDKDILKQVKKAAFSGIYSFTKWANSAPVIIVILAQPDLLANKIGSKIQGTAYYLIDIGIAVEHLILQATELNLGTCWIGWFDTKKTRRVLKIPKKYKIVSLLTLGYFTYNQKQNKKKRKSLDNVLFFNKLQGV